MTRIHTAASALRPFAVWAIGLLFVSSAAAQGLRIDITGVGDKQIPVAVAPLVPASPNERVFAETVQEVLEANLRRTGAFNLLPVGPQFPVLSDNTPLSQDLFLRWKNQGASALVVGSISRQPDGKVDLRFRLLDNLKSLDLGGLSLITEATQLDARRSAHKVADYVYEQLTGEPGFFSTRLAYVRKEAGRQVLIIADSDGENAQPALRSSQPIISLAWSPDGNKLAYVSFESGKAVVYVHELQTGRRTVVANYRGSNSAPAWSPDGKQLAVVLTKDGSSQVYVMNADGSSPRRVSRANAINTEPSFSADGKSIYFTSDRGGSPQIYRVPADASSLPERISFTGNFNARPMVSPDGKLLAFVARREGKFVIGVRTLESGEERLVSTGPKDDSPSFAPNSRWIIFSSRINARDTLSAVSVDGRVRTRISLDTAGIRNPAWGRMP
ncbi:MAG: Tol-Pal system beta propeller repeat protein TolB [Burkholderiaceae bacterium]|jgi:TolB protein